MVSTPDIMYIAIMILFGVNSFNELDGGKYGRPGNYVFSGLTSLFWPLTLLYSILYMMFPRPRRD